MVAALLVPNDFSTTNNGDRKEQGRYTSSPKCTTRSHSPQSAFFPPREVDYFGRVELAFVQVKKMDVKFSDAVNWKPNVSCQFS